MNRLESVNETLRAALNEIAKVAPEWLYLRITDEWLKQYLRRIEEYRLPKGKKARDEYGSLVGSRTLRLLTLIEADDTSTELKNLKMVKILRQMWNNQFEIKDGRVQFLPAKELPPAGERFDSPYDTEARYGNKRATTWRGYKVHYTEICDADYPFLICNVETTAAIIPDIVMGKQIHESLEKKTLLPTTHLLIPAMLKLNGLFKVRRRRKLRSSDIHVRIINGSRFQKMALP